MNSGICSHRALARLWISALAILIAFTATATSGRRPIILDAEQEAENLSAGGVGGSGEIPPELNTKTNAPAKP